MDGPLSASKTQVSLTNQPLLQLSKAAWLITDMHLTQQLSPATDSTSTGVLPGRSSDILDSLYACCQLLWSCVKQHVSQVALVTKHSQVVFLDLMHASSQAVGN